MLGAYDPYAPCIRVISTVHTGRKHRCRKTRVAFHPALPMNRAIKQKGEVGKF